MSRGNTERRPKQFGGVLSRIDAVACELHLPNMRWMVPPGSRCWYKLKPGRLSETKNIRASLQSWETPSRHPSYWFSVRKSMLTWTPHFWETTTTVIIFDIICMLTRINRRKILYIDIEHHPHPHRICKLAWWGLGHNNMSHAKNLRKSRSGMRIWTMGFQSNTYHISR